MTEVQRERPGAFSHSARPAREHGIRHVLVCLDRSQLAEGSLPYARFIADAFDAQLTLLHVLASPEGDQPSTRPNALDWELTWREAEQYLADVQFKLEQQGVARQRVVTEISQGRPAERQLGARDGRRPDFGHELFCLASWISPIGCRYTHD